MKNWKSEPYEQEEKILSNLIGNLDRFSQNLKNSPEQLSIKDKQELEQTYISLQSMLQVIEKEKLSIVDRLIYKFANFSIVRFLNQYQHKEIAILFLLKLMIFKNNILYKNKESINVLRIMVLDDPSYSTKL